ncbi:MAG: hypothetical protein HGA87_07595 [Desulfobulbaceae bacterium]|nr:hypothetical protein [Desulfobulbaceae bacterium]
MKEKSMRSSVELGSAVVESLTTEMPSDLLTEYTEIGLDNLISDGLLKDIPVVNTIVALGKLGISIHDRLFVKKLLTFLVDFQAVSYQDRVAMVHKLESDPQYGRKVGEHIVELLDRIESHMKPRMVSLVFKAYSSSIIDGVMLHRLNNAIERIPVMEVKNIRTFRDSAPKMQKEFDPISLQAYVNSGLAEVCWAFNGLRYDPNDVCSSFLELELDRVQI